MKILVVTQKIDRTDAVLGFMHEWIREFSKHSEGVVAIGLGVGAHDLPSNVKVETLGKGLGPNWGSVVRKVRYAFRFWYLIWKYKNEYDAVFVHMNQIYVILGSLIWKPLGKRVSLWYAHGHVPFSLRLAERFADTIFTSTKSGCRLASSKVQVIGQGIDTEKFSPLPDQFREGSPFTLVTVGRISPSKGLETVIQALSVLKKKGKRFRAEIVGDPVVPSDGAYLEALRRSALEAGLSADVSFRGAVANKDLPPRLRQADLFVNAGKTGSLDKAVPEAMAVGLPILTSNEAFLEVLGPYTDRLMFAPGDQDQLAQKIEEIMDLEPARRAELGSALREIVVRDHSLASFAQKIVSMLAARP